jgi:hypothetical protein
MEKEEKKTQLDWVVPSSLHRISCQGGIYKILLQSRFSLTISFPMNQYLARRSVKVRGMVKVHSRRSDMARLPMKMFLAVSIA